MPDTSDASATQTKRVRLEQRECMTSATRTTTVQQDCYTNDTSAIQVKNFSFDNDTTENMFSHPYISYMANERIQGEEQFHSPLRFSGNIFRKKNNLHDIHLQSELWYKTNSSLIKVTTITQSIAYILVAAFMNA